MVLLWIFWCVLLALYGCHGQDYPFRHFYLKTESRYCMYILSASWEADACVDLVYQANSFINRKKLFVYSVCTWVYALSLPLSLRPVAV